MSSLPLALGQASTILPTYIPPFLWSASRVPVGTYKSLKNSDIFGTALRALTFLGIFKKTMENTKNGFTLLKMGSPPYNPCRGKVN